MPELHVIAAGSLLDFAIEKVGIPVGRIEALYMRPMSFIEYLAATDNHVAIRSIMNHATDTIMQEPMHTTYIQELGTYLALGGMPESIASWIDTKNPLRIERIHASILDSYKTSRN